MNNDGEQRDDIAPRSQIASGVSGPATSDDPRWLHHRLIKRINMRPRWGAEGASSAKAAWTPIDAQNARAALLTLGPGAISPPASYSSEHILLHLTGQIICEVEGRRYLLEEHDLLFIPAYVTYGFFNAGNERGSWFSVDLPLDDRPSHRYRGDEVLELGQPWPFDDEGNPTAGVEATKP